MLIVSNISDRGRFRENNEDSLSYKAIHRADGYFGYCVVADGAGGTQCGEVASKIAIQGIDKWFRATLKLDLSHFNVYEDLNRTIQKVNDNILRYKHHKKVTLASTLSLLIFLPTYLYTVQLGDSEVRSLNSNGQILEMTDKHLNFDPRRNKNVLTKYLGSAHHCNPQFHSYKAFDGFFLLGTDGFFNRLQKQEINELQDIDQTEESFKLWLSNKALMLRERGERDNISAILLYLRQPEGG